MSGYNRLASLMGTHPEVAVLRRFGSLNALNILGFQAELTHLELKLKKYTKADADSGHPDRTLYDRDWQTLSDSAQAPDGNSEQWQTILAIRKKLKQYNGALLLQKFILKSESPNPKDLRFLQTWMKNPAMGNVYLLGPDSDIWENPDYSDLIVLKQRNSDTLVSQVLSDFLIHWYHHLLGWRFREPDSAEIYANTVYYSQDTLLRISSVIGTICASILPVIAIVVLYNIASMARRLAIIGVFTVVFSAALGILTNGRAVEIFATTSAFAAVQVVFVGTTYGNLTVASTS